ncbi:MAG: hypothetical protein WDO13_06765 [Verrucomicrobiota bacterium]
MLTTIWFTWGGISDSLALFRQLRAERVNPLDNGVVIDHQNLAETAAAPRAESSEPSTQEAISSPRR